MNVIRLMGGLGNQLFQYAFGRAMMENGLEVRFDISNFGKSKHREFMLGSFNMNLSFSGFVHARSVLDSSHVPTFDLGYLKLDGKNFFGYWQYLVYFKHILPQLKKEMTVQEKFYTDEYVKFRDEIKQTNSVGVHVRRDDYIGSSTIPCLPFSYYYEAIQRTKGDLYIFSDDIEWCKHQFIIDYFERQITFIHLPYYLDFELLKFCKSKVICNSTFSWWTAILSDNDTVVTPNFWVTPKDRAKRNNFPGDWIQLECDV